MTCKALGTSLDQYEKESFYWSPATEYLWSYLCHSGNHMEIFSNPNPKHIGSLGNLMLGYQLFDMLALTNGFRGSMKLEIPRIDPGIPLGEKLETILNVIQDWTTIVPYAQHLAAEAFKSTESQSLTFQDSTILEWQWTISNLFQASQQEGNAEWHKVLRNFYSMAFVVCWFSIVSIGIF